MGPKIDSADILMDEEDKNMSDIEGDDRYSLDSTLHYFNLYKKPIFI